MWQFGGPFIFEERYKRGSRENKIKVGDEQAHRHQIEVVLSRLVLQVKIQVGKSARIDKGIYGSFMDSLI